MSVKVISSADGEAARPERRGPETLDELPLGAAARVVRVEGAGPVARRLMEMGIVPGARVQVVREAPLGDPVEVRVMGYHLALRRSEARTVKVVSDERKSTNS